MKDALKQSWWVLLLRGAVALIFALILLVMPGLTLATGAISFVLLFSIYALVEGISVIVNSVRRREGQWFLMLLFGIVSILAGLFALGNPMVVGLLTITMMVYIVAFKAIAGGIIEMVEAWQIRKEIDNEWLLALNGFLSLVFGLILLRRPITGVEVLLLITAFYLLMSGAIQVVLAFKVRGWLAESDPTETEESGRFMTKRNMIIAGAIVVVAVIALAGYSIFQNLTTFPTSEEAGLSFQTVTSSRPAESTCLNNAGAAGLAKELINIRENVVVAGVGASAMPDDEWADYSPGLPWQKNVDRNTMFTDHCFYRSPMAPVDCQSDECREDREVDGYSWVELSVINAQDCFATGDAECSALGVDPGAISVTVTSKCHQITFEDEIYELVDPAGNRYVMHATDTGTPDLNPELPEGWTLSRTTLDEPLEVLPVGGGESCYHNVLRDNLGQGYHQYVFADDQYPATQN